MASEREWYCMRGLRPISPSTTTAARLLLPAADPAIAVAVGLRSALGIRVIWENRVG